MDFEKTLLIKPKTGRTYFAAVFYTFWLIIALVGLYTIVTQEAFGLWHLVYALLIAIAAWEIRKNIDKILSTEQYSLQIGPKGLFHFRTSKEPLPWSEVGEISSYKTWGKTMIRIQRTNGGFSSDQIRNQGKLEKRARPTRQDDYLLDTSLLQSSPEELVQTIKTYAEAWREQTAPIQ